MKKKISLGLLLVLFVGLSAGQTLQDFEYSLDDGFEKSFTGGESLVQEINFTNAADRPVPLAVEVRVEAEEHGMTDTGEEFDLSESTVLMEDTKKIERLAAKFTGEQRVLVLDEPQNGVTSILNSGPPESPCNSGGDWDEGVIIDCDNIEDVYSLDNVPENIQLVYDRDEVEGQVASEGYVDADESRVVPYLDSEENFELHPATFSEEYNLVSGAWYDEVDGTGVYRFSSSRFPLISSGSDVSLDLVLESNQRIRPDDFSFEFDVRSKAGFASDSGSVEVDEDGKANVTVGNNSVSVNSESGANVNVESYDKVAVSPPSGNEFVGGVGVEVTDSNQDEVEANGTVSIGYSQARIDSRDLDEDSISVRYFNESRGEWTTEGVEVVNRDTEDNTVTAEADHFSVYAAFAQPEPEQEPESEPETQPAVFTPGFDPVETQEASEQNQTQDEQPPSDDETDQPPVDEGTNESEDTGQSQEPETDEPGQPENTGQTGPTGLFTAEPASITGGLLVVLVAVIGYLQYAGRIELGNALSYLSRD